MAEFITSLVERHRAEFLKRLPKYLSPEHFFQLCHALDKDARLRAVAERNPDSVLSAIFKAADCGLIIGGPFQHCFVAAFGNEAVFMVGWKGMVYQWIHAGAVLKVNANVVYVGDEIEVNLSDDEISHKPALSDPNRNDPKWVMNPANIIGSYAIATLPTGIKQSRWVPRGMIEVARSRSQTPSGPGWGNNYPQMAQKTAVRRLDGLIQVCGPTPENKEAWERHARTIELDREQFDRPEEPDDLPGEKLLETKAAGAGMERGASSAIPPPSNGRKEEGRKPRSSAPTAPPPPQAKPDELIDDARQDALIELGGLAGMKSSVLRKYVQEHYEVNDLKELHESQATRLAQDLEKRLGK